MQKYSRQKCEELYDALNRKHFIEGGVLNDMGLLLDTVEQVGLDRAACEEFLLSSTGEREVLETVDRVQALGIHSIPTLVLDGGKYVLNGAADSAEVSRALRRIVLEKKRSDAPHSEPSSVFQQGLTFW